LRGAKGGWGKRIQRCGEHEGARGCVKKGRRINTNGGSTKKNAVREASNFGGGAGTGEKDRDSTTLDKK